MTERTMSFVVLAFNGGEVLEECIASLLAVEGQGLEVLVVDNGSTDGSIERTQRRHPGMRLVRNGINLGFAVGMNRGIAATTGEIVVPVNQDAILRPNYATAIRQAFDAGGDRIGVVCGTVLRRSSGTDGSDVDGAGYYLAWRFAAGRPRIGPARDVLGVSGACPALLREMLEDTALGHEEYYDSAYVHGFEDIDLFLRASLRSWRVRAIPEVVASHYRGWSSGGRRRFYSKPAWMQRKHFANRYATFVKCCPLPMTMVLGPTMLLAEILLWPYLLLRRPAALVQVILAWGDVAAKWRSILERRRRIQDRRSAPWTAMLRLVRGI